MSRKHPLRKHYLRRKHDCKLFGGVTAKKGDIIVMTHAAFTNKLALGEIGFWNTYDEVSEDEYKLHNLGK